MTGGAGTQSTANSIHTIVQITNVLHDRDIGMAIYLDRAARSVGDYQFHHLFCLPQPGKWRTIAERSTHSGDQPVG